MKQITRKIVIERQDKPALYLDEGCMSDTWVICKSRFALRIIFFFNIYILFCLDFIVISGWD